MKRKSILDSVGNTPLFEIDGIYVKAEHLNPSGSIKDRIAKYFIEQAEKKGLLKKGYTIVEASSGNTGTALSMMGAARDYKVIIYIERGMTRERYQMMKAFGADVRRVAKTEIGLRKAIALGKKKGYFHPNQFANPWNYEEHQKVTGKEILRDLKGKKPDAIVAGMGTGGTIVGLGKLWKKVNPKAKVIGVEPVECALTYDHMHSVPNVCHTHHIEGIGDGFIPHIVAKNIKVLDDVMRIKSDDAIKEAKRIANDYGIFVGVCSGANLLAAKRIKKKYKLKTVVTLFTDEGEKYLSEDWFAKK